MNGNYLFNQKNREQSGKRVDVTDPETIPGQKLDSHGRYYLPSERIDDNNPVIQLQHNEQNNDLPRDTSIGMPYNQAKNIN